MGKLKLQKKPYKQTREIAAGERDLVEIARDAEIEAIWIREGKEWYFPPQEASEKASSTAVLRMDVTEDTDLDALKLEEISWYHLHTAKAEFEAASRYKVEFEREAQRFDTLSKVGENVYTNLALEVAAMLSLLPSKTDIITAYTYETMYPGIDQTWKIATPRGILTYDLAEPDKELFHQYERMKIDAAKNSLFVSEDRAERHQHFLDLFNEKGFITLTYEPYFEE